MSKRNIRLLAILLFLGLLVFWFLHPLRGSNTDEARYRNLIRASRSLRWLAAVESRLPVFMVRLSHLSDLDAKYWGLFQDERKELVASGYFVELPVPASKLTNLQMVFHAAGAYYIACKETNSIVVTCRPEQKTLYEREIENR